MSSQVVWTAKLARPVPTMLVAGKLRAPGVHTGCDVPRDFGELFVGG